MKAILPTAVRLKCTRKGRRATFVYEEDYGNPGVVKNSIAAFTGLIPEGLTMQAIGKKTVRISGTVDYSTLANMMMTEFLCWSTIGEMRFRDMLIGAFMARVRS